VTTTGDKLASVSGLNVATALAHMSALSQGTGGSGVVISDRIDCVLSDTPIDLAISDSSLDIRYVDVLDTIYIEPNIVVSFPTGPYILEVEP